MAPVLDAVDKLVTFKLSFNMRTPDPLDLASVFIEPLNKEVVKINSATFPKDTVPSSASIVPFVRDVGPFMTKVFNPISNIPAFRFNEPVTVAAPIVFTPEPSKVKLAYVLVATA